MKGLILVLSVWHTCSNSCKEKINPSCNYKLPPNCKLVYSEQLKKYAIRVDGTGMQNQYLGYYFGDFIHYVDITDNPEFFNDSCSAKGFCKSCVLQNAPKVTDLKEIP